MEIKPTSFARGVPASERNGFFGLEPRLMDRPDAAVVAVVVYEIDEVVHKEKRDERYPVVRAVLIEPLLDDDDAATALRLASEATATRTGALDMPEVDA